VKAPRRRGSRHAAHHHRWALVELAALYGRRVVPVPTLRYCAECALYRTGAAPGPFVYYTPAELLRDVVRVAPRGPALRITAGA